jgi:hypothetical protein
VSKPPGVVDKKKIYLSVDQVAQGLKVSTQDILELIQAGKIKTAKNSDGDFQVSLHDYQEYGSSMPPELMSKISQKMFDGMLAAKTSIQPEIKARFAKNNAIVLDRLEQSVLFLEALHRKYEPGIDIVNKKTGGVAAFVLYARIISLLHSIITLLRKGVPTEAMILFRPLWEAILMAEYFTVSDERNENPEVIQKWFEENESPWAKDVRDYVSKHCNLPLDTLKKLYNGYSKPVHHTYQSIMESYRGMTMSGFGTSQSHREGFDYHGSSIMRDVVEIAQSFEKLLESALIHFQKCFSFGLKLDGEEKANLVTELEFYQMNDLNRLQLIFSEHHSQSKAKYNRQTWITKSIRFYPIILTAIGVVIHGFALLGLAISNTPNWLHGLMLIVDSTVVAGLIKKKIWGYALAIALYIQQVIFQIYWAYQGYSNHWSLAWAQAPTVILCTLSLFLLIKFRTVHLNSS